MIGIQLKAMKEAAMLAHDMDLSDVPKEARLLLLRQSEDMLMVLNEMDRLRKVEDDLHGVLGEKAEQLEAAKEELAWAFSNDLRMREATASEQVQRLMVEVAVLKEVIDGE